MFFIRKSACQALFLITIKRKDLALSEINWSLIGKQIKRYRSEQHLSQMQLAELADISCVYLSNIENGKKHISLNVLIRIAKVLNVTCDDLLSGNQPQDKNEYFNDFSNIMSQCSNAKKQILIDFMYSIKNSISTV